MKIPNISRIKNPWKFQVFKFVQLVNILYKNIKEFMRK